MQIDQGKKEQNLQRKAYRKIEKHSSNEREKSETNR